MTADMQSIELEPLSSAGARPAGLRATALRRRRDMADGALNAGEAWQPPRRPSREQAGR